MKAYPLLWQYPQFYKDHIVLMGSFHTVCAYLRVIGKKVTGSGFEDILSEAALITPGSLNGVLTGKQYNRALVCHKSFVEALERLLFAAYLKMLTHFSNKDKLIYDRVTQKLNIFSQNINVHSLNRVRNDTDVQKLLDQYCKFRTDVRNGLLGKTATFWISYIDKVYVMLDYIKAVKTNDMPLYVYCMYIMSDLFFTYDSQNYASIISVARSLISSSRCAVDKTIEETFMRNAKSHSGAGGSGGAGTTGLLTHNGAYQRWVKSYHERTKYVDELLHMTGMSSDDTAGRQHKDNGASSIRNSENRVQRVLQSFSCYLNPFDLDDKSKLYIISSGAPVTAITKKRILGAEIKGKQANESFVVDRLKVNAHFLIP